MTPPVAASTPSAAAPAPLAPSAPPALVVRPGPASAAPHASGASSAAPASPQSAPTSSSASSHGNLGPARAHRVPQLSPLVVIGVAAVALLVGVFFLGRWSKGAFGSTVGAEERDERPSLESALREQPVAPSASEALPATSDEKAGLLARPKTLSAADAALLDLRNRYTVQAAQYNDTDLGRSSARRVFDYFVRQNVPVCTPYQRGDDIFVFVGAAPNTVDLEVVQRALKALGGPDGTPGAFKDAFIARIDSIVQRNP